jgi:hypothetical protein
VRGYPLIVDGHHADSELIALANVPVRARNNELLAVLVPGDGYVLQTRDGVFRTPFGVERNADITFDPAAEGRYVVRRASSPNPSRPGEEVTITVAVNPGPPAVGTPTGEVTFTESGSRLGSAMLDVQARAIFRIDALASGEHEIVVEYQGDASFAPSSARIRHRVA